MSIERPTNCRNRLRDEGKPYPRSGCASCKDGGLRGCPHERAATRPEREAQEAVADGRTISGEICMGMPVAAYMADSRHGPQLNSQFATHWSTIPEHEKPERLFRESDVRGRLATPPDAAATIERLQEQVRNLTVLLDQQFGTPCAQIAYAAELASLREKVKADVAAEREDAARAGWNACRKSIYAVCEDVMGENDKHREDTENSPRHHFGRGGMAAAKSIARGFNSMEAEDDDNFRAAIRARAALTTEEGLRDERGRPG